MEIRFKRGDNSLSLNLLLKCTRAWNHKPHEMFHELNRRRMPLYNFLLDANWRCLSFLIFVSMGHCLFNFFMYVKEIGSTWWSNSEQFCAALPAVCFSSNVRAKCDTAATDAGRITTATTRCSEERWPSVYPVDSALAPCCISLNASNLYFSFFCIFFFFSINYEWRIINGEPLVFFCLRIVYLRLK